MQLLNDSRVTRPFGEMALKAAWWSATDAGRDYIERTGRSHPSADVRRLAADILASWPPPE